MSLLSGPESLHCEQCGALLQSQGGEEGCLNCLLTTGIDPEEDVAGAAPNEGKSRFYQHYEILTRPDGSRWELGRGAMGVTYKARDVNLKTPVALKIINSRYSARPEARRRFLHEAQAAARLQHPNVASVFHFGTINALPELEGVETTVEENADAGDCFYAMEFVEGETLEARLRRSGPLSPALALEIAAQVTRALTAAEKRGLVHRDLKPSNIMLAVEEENAAGNPGASEVWVKVIDFGLAKLVSKESEPSDAEGFLGTLAFSSPEQIETRAVDGRSDIYSLGATLWYALTGKVPFVRKAGDAAGPRPAKEPPPRVQLVERNVPTPVIALLESMLAPEPRDRPQSAVALGEAIQRSREELAGRKMISSRTQRMRRGMLAGGVGLAAGLIGLLIYLTTAASRFDDKSIAVLPFRNLSSDPANAFFADGVQDDLLSRLVKIRDLKVISRLGTSPYSANEHRDLRAIGRALGVRHLVEGSLRRTGDRVLLHVSLVDARNGNEVWAESYDRKLADAINLQGELASAIADALNATLSPQESIGVRASSTHNPGAYVLYLQGRKLEMSQTYAIADYEAAEALFSQAIELDPGFALAHARLASALSSLYRFRGPHADLRRRAYAEAAEALRLQPDLGEAHLVSALCAYRMDRDFDRALPELQSARRLLPNDAEAESYIAYIDRRRGKWREARAGLERCRARDPRSATYAEELYTTAYLLRDWPAAERHAIQAKALSPIPPVLKVQRALVDLWRDGNLVPLQKVFASLPSYGDREGILAWMRWDAAMIARNFAAAQAAIDGFPFDTLTSVYSAPLPKSYLEGCLALAQEQRALAREKFEAARPAMEAETLAHPENALRHARLGLLYAYMGRKEDALREGKRAVEIKPIALDAYEGPEELSNLALIHAWVGEPDEAITLIETLLPTPGGVFFYEASMSWWELHLRWQWDPLRKEPRFAKILAAPEPATVY
ncbi:MAG: protein kinase [Spartobacteria bacterium]